MITGVIRPVESEYLIFEENPYVSKAKKTKVVLVISKRQDKVLGEIRWYGSWRQYAFYPYADTIWNIGCMRNVETCITGLMNERKS